MTTPLLFGLQIACFLAVIITFISLLLTRSKEHPRFLAGFNMILLGIFILLVSLFVELATSIRALFRILLLPVPVLENLQTVNTVVLLPLLALCLLVGVLLLRDRFTA